MNRTITLSSVRAALREKRYVHGDEYELQDGVEQVLTDLGLIVRREVRLSAPDRIDIMTDLPRPDQVPVRLGIEVKVQGTPYAVLSQLLRYTTHDTVDALILVTTMHAHMREVTQRATPTPGADLADGRWVLGGKPFEIALLSSGRI